MNIIKIMNWLPTLEYNLSHPHPKGHWFLLATVVIFSFAVPILVLVNLVTLGYDLVPSLQPNFQPNDTHLENWWGRRRIPSLLRPRTPPCEPRDLGRGDTFRLSSSLFDYMVMSTWNTSEGSRPSEVQEQKRVEYRGQSFTGCYANSALLDYSLVEQTQTVNIGVLCPGYDQYPIEISMQTTITFAWMLNKDFVGQFYGPGLRLLNLNDTNAYDYRRVIMETLQVISTDALTIMRRSGLHLSDPLLAASVSFDVHRDTVALNATASTAVYLNGTIPNQFPYEATIYFDTIWNLVTVATHAVNIDVGNRVSPNIFRNASLLKDLIYPNLAPNDTEFRINPADWAEGAKPFYYADLKGYQTWAQAVRDWLPVSAGNLLGLPNESVMVTAYLCPSYQLKPPSALLASVFVGSATMILSVWGAWMYLTAILARQIMEPQIICYCGDCDIRRAQQSEKSMKVGLASSFAAHLGVQDPVKHTYSASDLEIATFGRLANDGTPQPGRITDFFHSRFPSFPGHTTG